MGGTIPVLDWYIDNRPTSRLQITVEQYDRAFQQLNVGTFDYYGYDINSFYAAFEKWSLKNKTVLIWGLASCNCEAMALWQGASHVYVVDYNKPTCEHDRITVINIDELTQSNIQTDIAISFSSFEHDGLGRYGDPLNPNGDLDAMQMAYRHLKDDGCLWLGVPQGLDCLVWNAHRIYGEKRLPLLLKGWTVVDVFEQGSREGHSLGTYWIQPLMILKKDRWNMNRSDKDGVLKKMRVSEFSFDTVSLGDNLSLVHSSPTESLFQDGLSYHRHGDLTNASLHYQGVLELEPRHAGALHSLGIIALAQEDHSLAISYFEKALAICDSKAVYWNNYGVALLEIRRFVEAENAFEKAISLNENYVDGWSNLGRAQIEQKRYVNANKSLRNAIRLAPDHPEVHLHLIDYFLATHQENEAILLCRHLLKKRDATIRTKIRLGESLLQLERHEEALPVFEELHQSLPDHVEILRGLGQIYAELHQPAQSRATIQKIATLRMSHPLASWQHLSYCPTVFDETEDVETYWKSLHHELDILLEKQVTFDWRTAATNAVLPSFHLAHHGKCCRDIREKFATIYKQSFLHERPIFIPKAKIRVGFFSSPGNEDGLLRGTAGIIQQLDPQRFESFVFCFAASQERCRHILPDERICIVSLPRHFENASQIVRQTGCDIIYYWKVEPGTWNPFFAMTRPAPIQCTSWGTLGTSGFDAIDYYLTSPLMEPENVVVLSHYTERVEVLATFPMFEPRGRMPNSVSRNEFGLPQNGAIYFCPHRISKYHPSFDVLLKQILERDTNGYLVLKVHSHESTAAKQLKRRMTKHLGESLMRRVIFLGQLPHEQYRRLFSLATAVLDSPVFTGGYTAYDAFSMGIPMVTMPGEIGVQTFTSGFYRKLSMPEMITRSPEQYVESAVKLGTDRDFRENVSRGILSRCDVLFEEGLAVREFERFFEKAVQKELAR